MMTYEEALAFLNAPVYSQTRPGLGPVTELLRRLGNPQVGLRCVHITGTNGKGSTAAFIDSALREAGYLVGLYTSPFIERFTERIRVDGSEIPDEDLARLTERVKQTVGDMTAAGQTAPTIFEMVTAVAFLYFQERACDVVVLEVGMGGRLDATNVIRSSEVSVITTIDYDHMQFLGNTLTEIAHEKAGIIKPRGTVVSAPQRPEAAAVLRETAAERGADLTFVDTDSIEVLSSDISGQRYRFDGTEISIAKLGTYQIENSAVAYTALKKLQSGGWALTDAQILAGLKNAAWAGRLEVVGRNPLMIIDGAHNPNGVEGLTKSLKQLFPGRKLIFVAGVLADKDYMKMFRMVEPLAKRFLTVTPACSRALAADALADCLRQDGMEAVSYDSIPAAVEAAKAAGPDEIVVCFGSLYYIGDVRLYLRTGKVGTPTDVH